MSKASPAFAPRDDRSAACLTAYELHLDYVFTALRRMRVPPCDREDLAHNVFLALWTSWPKVDLHRPLRPYLFGIAFNVASAYRRKALRPLPPKLQDERESTTTPEELLCSAHTRRTVLAALNAVPLIRRAVILMHDIDGVPVTEVARSLSISQFTVYGRLKKGRRELSAAIRRGVGATAVL